MVWEVCFDATSCAFEDFVEYVSKMVIGCRESFVGQKLISCMGGQTQIVEQTICANALRSIGCCIFGMCSGGMSYLVVWGMSCVGHDEQFLPAISQRTKERLPPAPPLPALWILPEPPPMGFVLSEVDEPVCVEYFKHHCPFQSEWTSFCWK